VAYIPEEGKIRLGFASKITPYLSQLSKEFTCYRIKNIGKMNSIYAIRLYELLMQWKTTSTQEIDWLRTRFELEDKYSSIKDFKLKVIDPAVKDINTHSNYNVS
jgi:plasmid replication initiation protein